MVEKDNYATTSPLNEGSTVGNLMPNSNYIDSPFGNVKIYDLDAEIPPIERVQIVPNVQNLAPAIPSNTPAIQQTSDMTIPASISESNATSSTITPITDLKKPNYLLYGLGALVLALVTYKVFNKKK